MTVARGLDQLAALLGFFAHGYFSLFGAMLAELFPTRIRATAQGFCYNGGRFVSAATTYGIGTTKYGLWRTVRVILDQMTVKFLIRYAVSPMKLFGGRIFSIPKPGATSR